MKTLVVTFLLVLSQFATAKIADFNSLIKEHSKLQNELHESISAASKAIEAVDSEQDKKPEIIVLDSNREVYSQVKIPRKNANNASNGKKKYHKADDIEEQQFLRLGEEFNNAN